MRKMSDSIIETLMNLEGKTNDNINSCFDLEFLGIRPKLHATMIEEGKYISQHACFTMSSLEKYVLILSISS